MNSKILIKLFLLVLITSISSFTLAAEQAPLTPPKVDYTPLTILDNLSTKDSCSLSSEIINALSPPNKKSPVDTRIVDYNNFCCYNISEDSFYNFCAYPHWQDAQNLVMRYQTDSNECRARNGTPLRVWTVSACFNPTRTYTWSDHLTFEEFRELWNVNLRDCSRDLTQTYRAMLSDCASR